MCIIISLGCWGVRLVWNFGCREIRCRGAVQLLAGVRFSVGGVSNPSCPSSEIDVDVLRAPAIVDHLFRRLLQ